MKLVGNDGKPRPIYLYRVYRVTAVRQGTAYLSPLGKSLWTTTVGTVRARYRVFIIPYLPVAYQRKSHHRNQHDDK